MNQSRTPAGIPTGGQFAASARSESEVSLGGPSAQSAQPAQPGQVEDRVLAEDRTRAAFEGETEVRRFSCEHHDEPGSCTPDCVTLVAAMSEGSGEDYVHDPERVRGGPPTLYDTYEYDAEQRASICVTHVPEGETLPESLIKGQQVRIDGETREVDSISVGRWDVHVDFAGHDREPDGSPTAFLTRKFPRHKTLDLIHPDDVE